MKESGILSPVHANVRYGKIMPTGDTMAFVHDRAQYRTYDADRRLTFHLSGLSKEQEARLSLMHDDGSGVIALAFPKACSPALNARINALNASHAESWAVAMPHVPDYSIGGIAYSHSELAALLQEAADVNVSRKVHEGEIALCELSVEF